MGGGDISSEGVGDDLGPVESAELQGVVDIPAGLAVQGDLAEALVALQRFDKAEPLARDALVKTRALFGEEHPQTAKAAKTMNLALVQRGQGP